MASDCFNTMLDKKTLEKIFGKERAEALPPKLIKEWLSGVDKIKEAFDRGELPELEFRRALEEQLEISKAAAETQSLMKAADAFAKARVIKHLDSKAWVGRESEGLRAYLTKTFYQGNNAKVGAESKISAREQYYTSMLNEGLAKNKLTGIFLSNKLDDQIALAHHSLVSKKPMPEGISKEAQMIASLIQDANDLMFKDMMDNRMPVKYKKSRVTLQTHDPKKLRSMGKEKWVEFVKKLNPDKSYLGPDAYSQKGFTDILNEMYDDMLLGKHSELNADGSLSNIPEGDAANASVGSSKIGKRALNFGPKETLEYNRQAGIYSGIAQTLVADMRKTAAKVTLFEYLGDKPGQTLNKAITQTVAKLKKAGNEKAAMKLEGDRKNLNAQLARVARTTSIPGSETLANVERIIGGAEVVSKLPNTGLRSFSNIANGIMQIKTQSGKNILQASSEFIFGAKGTALESLTQTYSKEAGDFFTLATKQMNASVRGGGFPGFATKAADFTLKWNGMDFLNNLFENTIVLTEQKSWAQSATQSFEKLAPGRQASLLSFGVTKDDWNVFQHAIEEASDGSKFVTIEGVDKIPDVEIQKVMAARGLKTTVEKYKKELKLNMMSYFQQISDIATTSPGAREAAALLGDSQTGTAEGAIRSIAMRFKSFTAQALNVGRSFNNSGVDPSLLAQGVARSEGNSYSNVAQWMAMATVMGYLTDTLIRKSQGKDAQDPTSTLTYLDAFGKSSAGGMYMDAFNGEWDRYSAAQTLVGPTFGQIEPLYSAVTNVKKGIQLGDSPKASKEFKEATMDVTKIIRSYVPFQQAVGVKQALDHAQFRVIKEALYPGSNWRYDAKIAREKMREERRGN